MRRSLGGVVHIESVVQIACLCNLQIPKPNPINELQNFSLNLLKENSDLFNSEYIGF